jgi:uroporphyrinogen decarboxylase
VSTGRREAFRRAVRGQSVDHLILDLCGCPLSGLSPEAERALITHLGVGNAPDPREAMLSALDIDTRGVGDILCPPKSLYKRLNDTAYIDEWGVERHYTGLYWDIVNAPLKNLTVEDLDSYPWPDPDSIPEEALLLIRDRAKFLHEQTETLVCASHPVYGVFELGLWMCGFEEFMVRLYEDEPFVRRFFEIVLAYQLKVIRRYYLLLGPFIDYTSSGDDFATQSSLFLSPSMFRDLIAPYFEKRIRYTKQFTDAPYLHHSCGNVSRLIPDLIACGVDILNPIQPCAPDMAPEALYAAFSGKIAFHGGLDTQKELPGGTPETVTRAVHRLLTGIEAHKGGYIFAAAHNLQGDVPPENIVAMFRAARNWKPTDK